MSENQIAADIIESLLGRNLPDGGFSITTGGPFRPDCTAWAVLALKACGCETQLIQPALARLAGCQAADGRVPYLKNFAEDFWPTALALLAWDKEPEFESAARKAITFLLEIRGVTLPYDGDATMGHNTSLAGWPWVENTYAWVAPTSMAMIALKAQGLKDHARVGEGVLLLLDRQLPSGGWNYGDTLTFGTQLLPFPDTTGFALAALGGLCEQRRVAKSICYLQEAVENIRTPHSLSWALIGLDAWSERPAGYQQWLDQSITLQARYGEYDTDLLAQLIVAGQGHSPFTGFMTRSGG